MSHPVWAIVPVKSLADAKRRLACVLPLEARRRLMLTMLQDVLAVLRRVKLLQPVLVVTPDAHVAEVAEDFGARVLRETESRGHTAAAIAGFAEARTHRAAQALTLPGDAPLVTPDELHSILAAAPLLPSPRPSRREGQGEGRKLGCAQAAKGDVPSGGWLSPGLHTHGPARGQTPGLDLGCLEHGGRARGLTLKDSAVDERGEGDLRHVTLVPSRDGDGTNALLVSPPDAFAPSFGPGSFVRHKALASQRGIACRVICLPGLGMDVDEPHDLLRLMFAKRGDRRYAFLDTHCGHLVETFDQR